MTTTNATFSKLPTGDWGIRVEGDAQPGQSVHVTKRNGSAKEVTIERVLSTADGVSVCAIRDDGNARRPARKGRRSGRRVSTYYSPTSGFSGTRNSAGRCEDAPCCGCCTF